MSNLDPSIANVLRGRMDVGSDNISHAHHLPAIPMPRTPDYDGAAPDLTSETAPEASTVPQAIRERIGRAGNYLAMRFGKEDPPHEHST
jgi:hypothetical protein